MKSGILDTSLNSENDGDQIIVESILKHYPEMGSWPRFPTHTPLTKNERAKSANLDLLVVTGTNILTSRALRDRQWRLRPHDIAALYKKVIFLGVGWRQYQGDPSLLARAKLAALKFPGVPVAARDAYTVEKLSKIGVEALNTGCPTMWSLPPVLPALGAERRCITTLTSYNPNNIRDLEMIEFLSGIYDQVQIWPQGYEDAVNAARLKLPRNVHVASRGLSSLDSLLVDHEYVGTRLHAGIRAAQAGKPSLVVAVDNRAIEISRDTGFPVVARKGGRAALEKAHEIAAAAPSNLRLPHTAINTWKTRFDAVVGDRVYFGEGNVAKVVGRTRGSETDRRQD